MEVSISLDVFLVGVAVAAAIFFGLGAVAGSIETAGENFNEQYERWVDAHLPPEPLEFDIAAEDVVNERDDDSPGFDLYGADAEYPDPNEGDLMSPRFEAIWKAIKGWDISRKNDGMYSGPTGNDVMHIIQSLDAHYVEPGRMLLQCRKKAPEAGTGEGEWTDFWPAQLSQFAGRADIEMRAIELPERVSK